MKDQLEALKIMTEKRDQGVSAFIGPDEFCHNEAMIASAWNLPMIAFVRFSSYNTIQSFLSRNLGS